MDFISVLFPIFSFVMIYYTHEIIKHLIELRKLQDKSNELLYEMNSKLSSLINK